METIKKITESTRPPLGKSPNLHQAYEGTDICLYCGKPVKEWRPLEDCPVRKDKLLKIIRIIDEIGIIELDGRVPTRDECYNALVKIDEILRAK